MIKRVSDERFGVYLHIPFCLQRCRYCDFFSTEGKWKLIPAYVAALIMEVRIAGRAGARPPVGSVYFGGGTPSLLAPAQLEEILGELRRSFALAGDVEITLEANPKTTDREQLAGYRAAGVNRLSLGIQSADDAELRMLGRIHQFADTSQVYDDARRAGLENINLDLIFGLPGQTPAGWSHTLDRALTLAPEHISIYSLTLEPGTELARQVRCGALPEPEEDAAADMYELAGEKLAAAGFRQYEISNWARDGGRAGGVFPRFACRHNLQYWRNLPYIGLGAGAHGCAGGRRYANIRSVEKYIARMRSPRDRRFPMTAAATINRIRSREDEIRETMWLGLRLTDAGVSRAEFRGRFDEDYCDRFRKEIDESVAEGLLEWVQERDRLRLTERGRLLGNRVFARFV